MLLPGHRSAHCFLVLAWPPVTIQHRKRSRHSRNGHVQNFDRQGDVDVTGVRHGQTGPGPRGSSDLWCLSCREYKVSFALWNLFAGMGTSENQHTSNVVNRYVESDQHQWSRDRCRTHLCTVQTRADKELVMSCASVARSLVWAAWTCSHIQLQVYLVTEFTSPQVNGGL